MKWYEKQHDIDGTLTSLMGTFIDSELKISAVIQLKPHPDPKLKTVEMYVKPINMWAHQEVLAEDILTKFQGIIKKCENRLPALVEQTKLRQRI